MRRSRSWPRASYANVTSTLALCLALGGGVSYATGLIPANSVGTKQLKNGAVTGRKVHVGSLLAKDFKAGQVPAGRQGPTGFAGPTGPAGPAGAKGEQGQAGLAAAFTDYVSQGTLTGMGPQDMLSVDLPQSGAYVVFANAVFQRGDTDTALRDDIVCVLKNSFSLLYGPLDAAEVALPPSPAKATISLMSAVEFPPSALEPQPRLWLTCTRTGNGVGDLTFTDADLGALQLTSIS
jgi:hypothetical protein